MEYYDKIGIGSVQFGLDYGISNSSGITPLAEVASIIEYSKQIGIDTVDTASYYNLAEFVLGKTDLNSFKVISKFMPPSSEGKNIKEQFKESIEKLNISGLYGYLAHRPQDLIANPKQWQELIELKAEQKVRKIGFSLNSVEELNRLLDIKCIPDLVQVPFNYLDNRFENSMISLKENGCEIHTRSTFLQGLFFTDTTNLPPFFDEVKSVIKKMQIEFGSNLSNTLLKYVLDKSCIDKVIIGIENKEQLEKNLENLTDTPSIASLENIISQHILMPSNWPKK